MRTAFAALLLACLAGCGIEEPLSEADKSLFLRPADLVRYGFQYDDPASYEKFSKSRQIDGAYQLKYEFKPDGSERRRGTRAAPEVRQRPEQAAPPRQRRQAARQHLHRPRWPKDLPPHGDRPLLRRRRGLEEARRAQARATRGLLPGLASRHHESGRLCRNPFSKWPRPSRSPCSKIQV